MKFLDESDGELTLKPYPPRGVLRTPHPPWGVLRTPHPPWGVQRTPHPPWGVLRTPHPPTPSPEGEGGKWRRLKG